LTVQAAWATQVEHHAHAVALHFTGCNFARIHKTLRVSPTMQAGIGRILWSVEDLARFVD
jgi:hypothetical protein